MAIRAHREGLEPHLMSLLALLEQGSGGERKLSRLGELVLSAPSHRGIEPVLQLVTRAECPLWLPGRVLDVTLDCVADGELDLSAAADWLLATCPSTCMSTEAGAKPVEGVSGSHRAAWEFALGSDHRRNMLVYLCMELPENCDAACAINRLTCGVRLLRLYLSSPAGSHLPHLEATIDLFIKRSLLTSETLIDSSSSLLLGCIDTLLGFWCELLRPHETRSTPPQAIRTLAEFPQLFAQLFRCVAYARAEVTAVWAHVTDLLNIGAEDRCLKGATEWLAAAVVKMHIDLEQSPVYLDLKAAPRKADLLTESSIWEAMLQAARPLVPESWYEDVQATPACISAAELSYENEKRLAQAELEAEAEAVAVAERAAREEKARQEELEHQAQAAHKMQAWQEMWAKHAADMEVAQQQAAEAVGQAETEARKREEAAARAAANESSVGADRDSHNVAFRATEEAENGEEEEVDDWVEADSATESESLEAEAEVETEVVEAEGVAVCEEVE
uniref:Uncharacterized protein n=1 Tax=Haptolina ericina TaxID=156174 RepID=A0A7S3APV4_9EUKA